MAEPLLSVIIPAYNEERRLPENLHRVTDYLRTQDYRSEVVVVDDGSTDSTPTQVEGLMAEFPSLSLVRTEHRGKGHAVKTGILSAKGQYLFVCDADLSMPIQEVAKFLPPNLSDYDVAIASREVPGAKRYNEPPHRHLMGRVFNWTVRLFAVRGFQDTQCGFKSFRRDVARDIFPYQTMDGWGFDVEVLFIAQRRGYKIVEVPIDWYYYSNSRIRPLHDAFTMFKEVLQVRINNWKGKYKRRQQS